MSSRVKVYGGCVAAMGLGFAYLSYKGIEQGIFEGIFPIGCILGIAWSVGILLKLLKKDLCVRD